MPRVEPDPGPDECRNCLFYRAGSPSAAAGTCRLKAPVVLPESRGSAVWPAVMQIEWCAEHRRRHHPRQPA